MEAKIKSELDKFIESDNIKIKAIVDDLKEVSRRYIEDRDIILQKKQLRELEVKTKFELDNLMKSDNIEMKAIVDYLKEISIKYIEERDALLEKKQLKEAKEVHNRLADIYLYVADKITDKEVKESLKSFAFYWLRSGETEMFIEPAMEPILGQRSLESKNEKKGIVLTHPGFAHQEFKIAPSPILYLYKPYENYI